MVHFKKVFQRLSSNPWCGDYLDSIGSNQISRFESDGTVI